MNHNLIKDKYDDLFYRSKFSELIYSLKSHNIHSNDTALMMELVLLQASSYFELGQVEKSIDCLENYLKNSDDQDSDYYLLVLGRLSYQEGNWDQAEKVFLDMIESTDDPKMNFKALIGLASAKLSNPAGKHEDLEPIIFDLLNFPFELLPNQQVYLSLLLGTYYRVTQLKSEADTLKYFDKALKIASEYDWNYFVTRALYGKAAVYESNGKTNEMFCVLSILKSFIREKEHVFYSSIVNKMFERYEFKLDTPIEFDYKNQRIKLDSDWLLLHERPLLYRFIQMIYNDKNFVSKSELAEVLWPEEEYKSRVHDPRIFDLAKRFRKVLKETKTEKFTLLSGRTGYKLGTSVLELKEA